MRAIRQYAFGGPGELVHEGDVAAPRPEAGQVRIAVAAAGVTRLDLAVRAGAGRWLPELPTIPGREVAGVVESLGDGVEPRWLGRRVATCLGLAAGGYAELAVREVAAVHELADDVSDHAAVTAIGTGRAAVGVLDVARLTPEDVVLVLGSAGGVGSLLVQAAVRMGATVAAVAGGPARAAVTRRLGAAVTVDHTRPGWAERVREGLDGREVSVALDGVGGGLGRAALDLLGHGGRLVMYGWLSGHPVEVTPRELYERGLSLCAAPGPRMPGRPGGVRRLEERALAMVRDMVRGGGLTPLVQRFALSDAADAHAAMERRDTTGKVILVP
ncbi:zinc-binding dehydrogenase [Nonomuraea indica]|uniref:Zinc-binding dehydrogenase n=1 Tax=Nonomuraea indica TaxID=1581193 RepID=A0ABW8A9F9_9ACTN|nr:zinc-binding dehydrogenase [Nonomuraea indica]